MREIKFRAWNKKKNIMVFNDEDNSSDYWDGVCCSEVTMVNVRLEENTDYEYMQYTGLNDKNDKEIYEGDIVRLRGNEFPALEYKAIITFEFAGFMITSTDNKELDFLGNIEIEDQDLEVIGNIYENPELLNSEQ